jgi:hypothetical protein
MMGHREDSAIVSRHLVIQVSYYGNHLDCYQDAFSFDGATLSDRSQPSLKTSWFSRQIAISPEGFALVVDRLFRFACDPSETAGPSLALPRFPAQLCGVGEVRAAFRKPHTSLGRYRDAGNPGPIQSGMTKLSAVAHLGISGGGWTDSKKLIWISLAVRWPKRQYPTCCRKRRSLCCIRLTAPRRAAGQISLAYSLR